MLQMLIVPLIVAAAGGLASLYFLHRRLSLVIGHFPHVDGWYGNTTVLLTIFNRGYRNEEAINIELSPERTYHLAAHSVGGVTLEKHTLRIERIPGVSDAGIILGVGSGEFSAKTIGRFTSKDAKGKIRDSFEKVPPPPGYAFGILGTLFALALIVAGFGFFAVREYSPASIPEFMRDYGTQLKAQAQERGWELGYNFVGSQIGNCYGPDSFPADARLVKREGDAVILQVSFVNACQRAINASAKIDTPVEFPADEWEKYSVQSVNSWRIEPGTVRTAKLLAYMPEGANEPQLTLTVDLNVGNEFEYLTKVLDVRDLKSD